MVCKEILKKDLTFINISFSQIEFTSVNAIPDITTENNMVKRVQSHRFKNLNMHNFLIIYRINDIIPANIH